MSLHLEDDILRLLRAATYNPRQLPPVDCARVENALRRAGIQALASCRRPICSQTIHEGVHAENPTMLTPEEVERLVRGESLRAIRRGRQGFRTAAE